MQGNSIGSRVMGCSKSIYPAQWESNKLILAALRNLLSLSRSSRRQYQTFRQPQVFQVKRVGGWVVFRHAAPRRRAGAAARLATRTPHTLPHHTAAFLVHVSLRAADQLYIGGKLKPAQYSARRLGHGGLHLRSGLFKSL